jgi:hypothetical protein
MAWTTAEIQEILQKYYSDYVMATKGGDRKEIKAKILKELYQLEKDWEKSDKVFPSLPDEETLEKVREI